jgi:hypothetical protein
MIVMFRLDRKIQFLPMDSPIKRLCHNEKVFIDAVIRRNRKL